MQVKTIFLSIAIASLFVGLSACGRSSGISSTASGGSGTTITPIVNPTCASPLPPEAISSGLSITDKVPSDYDSTATPTPTPTTTIDFTLLLPQRCPGDSFPLILQSHGYGGTRIMSIAANGDLQPTVDNFDSVDDLVEALPYYGYVVISYNERGHGTPAPGTAPNNARIIDPAAETQDAEVLMDWAYFHRGATIDPAEASSSDALATTDTGPYVQSYVEPQPGTGIPRDIVVGTIGYSYGGGFQFPLEQLDPRVDTIVPDGTWNNLLYSLIPGDGVKLGFDSLLCLLASPIPPEGGNVNNTPLVANVCNLVGPTSPTAVTIRSRADLVTAATAATALPRPARDENELLDFFYTHSNQYFESPTRDGASIDPRDVPGYMSPALLALPGFAGASFRPAPLIPSPPRATPITALILQGNRDSLFNLDDAYLNYKYLQSTVLKQGATDTSGIRYLTNEGGHMNPLALQTQGTANCGGINGVASILAWFNYQLKGISSTDYSNIPRVCISVTPTPAANTAPTNTQLTGLLLSDGNIPVGDLGGQPGGISTKAAMITASVTSTGTAITSTGTSTPVFVPVGNPISGLSAIPGSSGLTVAFLAGIPQVQVVSVTSPTSALITPIAYVGVGIQRGSQTILVDDQVTPFAAIPPATGEADCPATELVPNSTYTGTTSYSPLATDHCHNRNTNDYPASNSVPGVLLPGVGEPLENGDQLGLLFYENQVQYLPVSSGAVLTGEPNPYTVTLYNVQLPVLVPGPGTNTYTDSTLSGVAALP